MLRKDRLLYKFSLNVFVLSLLFILTSSLVQAQGPTIVPCADTICGLADVFIVIQNLGIWVGLFAGVGSGLVVTYIGISGFTQHQNPGSISKMRGDSIKLLYSFAGVMSAGLIVGTVLGYFVNPEVFNWGY